MNGRSQGEGGRISVRPSSPKKLLCRGPFFLMGGFYSKCGAFSSYGCFFLRVKGLCFLFLKFASCKYVEHYILILCNIFKDNINLKAVHVHIIRFKSYEIEVFSKFFSVEHNTRVWYHMISTKHSYYYY